MSAVTRWLVDTLGDGDAKQAVSNVYWAAWIVVMFGVPESLAALHLIPMYTLSRTSWHDQQWFTWLSTILAGFLIGLIVHIRWAKPLGRAEIGGIVVALVAHVMWGLL